MPSAAELRELDDVELEDRLGEYRKELLNLRFQLATGQLDDTATRGPGRRDVARVMTILRDREIALAEGHEPHDRARPGGPRRAGGRAQAPGPQAQQGRGRRGVRDRGRGPGGVRRREAEADTDTDDAGDDGEDSVMAEQQAAEERGRRKVREGMVVSDKMQATVVVAVSEPVRHARYGKMVERTKRLYAHDTFEAKVGDRVHVMEHARPPSSSAGGSPRSWSVPDDPAGVPPQGGRQLGHA